MSLHGQHLSHKLRQKVFYSKNAKYKKKKIRSLLFPCTVFHSDKTSRLHAAQNTAPERMQNVHHPELLFIYPPYIQKSATPLPHHPRTPYPLGKPGQGARSSQGAAAAVPPESCHPMKEQSKRWSPPQNIPKSEEERRKENYGGSHERLKQEGNQLKKYINT